MHQWEEQGSRRGEHSQVHRQGVRQREGRQREGRWRVVQRGVQRVVLQMKAKELAQPVMEQARLAKGQEQPGKKAWQQEKV